MVEKDVGVTIAHLPSPLQGKRHFQIPCLILSVIRWVSENLYSVWGKKNGSFNEQRCLIFYFFLFLLLTSENISTDSQQKDRANVCFAHCYISQAQTMVRAPGFASLVKLAGLRLGFSKPLRVGAR